MTRTKANRKARAVKIGAQLKSLRKSSTRSAAVLLAGGIMAAAVVPEPNSQALADKPAQKQQERLEIETAGGETHVFMVEVARTPEQQQLGLMFRTSMEPNHGMLFLHKVPREASMWMRNTYISLDMIFFNKDGTIHRIEAGTQPLSERIIRSEGKVAGVLELIAGSTKRLGLKPGDKLVHPGIGR